ncbi:MULTISPECIES: ferric iron reductase [Thermomonosporaceae]|uniref:ferric iron reductase n=1 Tax=Thermomonosporaceae TaxID=2012 RepID=UPI00255A8C0D|nr:MULTISPECIES: ferric iron reductase [Thermomonosporaceae]MDL4771272.1 ferric iron reductase [Actinomadura xylanilytica]
MTAGTIAETVPFGELRAGAGPGWRPVTDPGVLDGLRASIAARYGAPPHVAAALAWKAYSWQAAFPVALGWVRGRRVPLMTAGHTVVRMLDDGSGVAVGLREVAVGVTAADPWAGRPGTVVVPDEAALAGLVRDTLLHGHLAPMVRALRARTRVGERPLWGSVAEALAAPMSGRHAGEVPGAAADAAALLARLGAPVAGLVEPSAEPVGVRRRTCCLWASLPGRSPCGTCCLKRDGEGG